jgi:O-antigen/teichoic acid export membrane protein
MDAPRTQHDVARALRNAVQLMGSLCFTWGIALAVRVVLPRHLGPDLFGALSFADAFASTAFLALALGIDTYVRKEVSVRTEHASDFWGGVLVLRALLGLVLAGAMALVLRAMHRPPEVQRLVWIFAVAQVFIITNATFSALLHAAGRVAGLSVLAVATKILWAAGIAVAIITGAGPWAFAASLAATEAIEAVVLWLLARKHLGLRTRIDRRATKAALGASLPFFVNTAAHAAYSKLDVSLLAGLASDREVGWYGAASSLAGLTMLLTPLIGWVLMPLMARAVARSRDELDELMRRAIEVVLVLAIPASLALAVGADFWVRLVFGAAFAPAATALRLLAPMFVMTYLAIIAAQALNLLDRGWSVTLVSFASLAVNATLDLVLIKPALRILGPGGAGAGCALGMVLSETFATITLLSLLGRRSFDRRSLLAIGKSALACAAVLACHRWAPGPPALRLGVDAAVYVGVALATGAIRVREKAELLRSALRRRQPAAA